MLVPCYSLSEEWRHLSPVLEGEEAEDGFAGAAPGHISQLRAWVGPRAS